MVSVYLQVNLINMKNVIKKAAKYESKKSLEGPMKFLKGNVSKTKKNSISIKKK